MSQKMTCPGCNSHTSDVFYAVERDDPCPYCGLPAESILAVDVVRQSRADQGLKEKFIEAEVRAGKAEAERDRLREQLREIREVLGQESRRDD